MFGKVYLGRIMNDALPAYVNLELNPEYQNVENTDVKVAIKTVHDDVDVECFKTLLSEIKILVHLRHHRNIVALIAACTKNIVDSKYTYIKRFKCIRSQVIIIDLI